MVDDKEPRRQDEPQEAFVARALASREQAHRTGEYYSAEEVLVALEGFLKAKRAGQ